MGRTSRPAGETVYTLQEEDFQRFNILLGLSESTQELRSVSHIVSQVRTQLHTCYVNKSTILSTLPFAIVSAATWFGPSWCRLLRVLSVLSGDIVERGKEYKYFVI